MVYAKGKNVQAAKDYIKWLWITNSQIQIDWNVGYGFHVPPRVSIAAQTPKLKVDPASTAVNILKNYGHATPPLWDATMDTALTDAVSNIVKNGGSNARSLLDAAADKCHTELQKLLS